MTGFSFVRPSKWLAFSMLLTSSIPSVVISLIPSGGNCVLSIMLPFTVNLDQTGDSPPASTGLFTKSRIFSLGYFHLAAALLAMEHFNARDTAVVPALAELADCSVQFDINNTMFLDTGTVGLLGNHLLFESSTERDLPLCAVAGPYFDMPAQNIAVVAAAAGIPHVPHRGYNVRLSAPHLSPMTINISPDVISVTQALAAFLLHIQRDNYIAYLYPLTDFGIQAMEATRVALASRHIDQWQACGYMPPVFQDTEIDRAIPTAMHKIKQRGYRTIVISLDLFMDDLPALANAAEALDMLNGDYVWIFTPLFEPATIHNLIQLPESLLQSQGISSFANVTKMLRGAALLTETQVREYRGDDDPFLRAWKEQDDEFVERVNRAYVQNTIQQGTKDMLMPPNFFELYAAEAGTDKMYDAILAIGLGACNASKENQTGHVTGISHRDSIRALNFTGATGTVVFGDALSNFSNTALPPPVRDATTVVFGVYNLYPPSIYTVDADADKDSSFDETFVLTEIVTEMGGPFAPYGEVSSVGNWTKNGPMFVYANGQVEAPLLLRDVPDQNYLPENMRIAGFTLMGICLVSCLASLVFVIVQRRHRIVRASQPKFLAILLGGAAVTALAIFTISFDESNGWDAEALSKNCMAAPWLFCVGHSIMYGALFSKLWRVNKVLQFTRRKISARQVAGPLVALLFATVATLTAWTLHDPLSWVRVEVDTLSGDSIGQCDSESMAIYVSILSFLMIIPTLLTCTMAWKTKDVDKTFTESSWIFTLIIVQIQVIMVSIPIVVILRDISTGGRYMGLVLLIWTFPMSTVVFIMGPKFVAFFAGDMSNSTTGRSSASRSRGASQGGVRVSGITGSGASSGGPKDKKSEMESAFVSGPTVSTR